MKTKANDEAVPLDSETLRWLTELANNLETTRGNLIASMLRDIRVDDQAAHEDTRH